MMRPAFLLALMCLMACKFNNSGPTAVGAMSSINDSSELIEVIPGAEQLALYVPKLTGQRCGLVVNQASLVGNKHLVDTLIDLSVNIERIFVPEHGFRGKADAGAQIEDDVSDLGIPLISLYGSRKKPDPESLQNIDVIIFDLQDVGVRCYTYISTLNYVMEACAEMDIKLIVLDRPNPNGHYIDGPILKPGFESLVGLHPVPLVYGMTIAEYAKMIKGENWINRAGELDMEIIPCHGYDHQTRYALPIKPSPNLPTYKSILLYPSLVLFEGTVVSAGRGTSQPFEHYGHPSWQDFDYSFVPEPKQGAMHPKFAGETCFGENLRELDEFKIRAWGKLNISYLINGYKRHLDQPGFFLENNFIDKLAGSDDLKSDILIGKGEGQIRESWEPALIEFKLIRKKYLIYP